jgi:hypothetical protein
MVASTLQQHLQVAFSVLVSESFVSHVCNPYEHSMEHICLEFCFKYMCGVLCVNISIE